MNDIACPLDPLPPAPPEGSASEPTLLLALLDAGRMVQERLESVLEAHGLSGARYLALQLLVQAGEPLTLGELAGRQRCVRSNVTQLVDRMEGDGLVRRAADPADRRTVRAVVTELGGRRHAEAARALEQLEAELVARIAPIDRISLYRVVAALRATTVEPAQGSLSRGSS